MFSAARDARGLTVVLRGIRREAPAENIIRSRSCGGRAFGAPYS